MQQAVGIRFRETMSGGVTLGVEDCHDGEQQGRDAGNILAMHGTITIDDMARFIAEPQHQGMLEATIDYPPFGTAIACHNGRFNLFSPSDDPEMKLMVYQFGFSHEGRDYFLHGRKEVRDDPGFDMWSDTTTLYTTLYRGTDDSGAVVGAGVLSLGVSELLALVASMEVLHAESTLDKVETLASFGRFFMGELWDTYVSRLA